MISYFTQVTICWGLFYLLYGLWLSKETFFNTNRWYLLFTLFAGLAIPLIEFQVPFNASPTEILDPAFYLETITVTAQAIENNLEEIVITPVNESWSLQFILLSIYWLGVLFFASRFAYGLFQIIRLVYRGKIIRKQNYFLVQTDVAHLPFSFMDYLFWSEAIDFNEEDHAKILRHELCHIQGKHSIDVLITELLCIFLWCSPFIFFYKKALKNIHEYLADDAVLKDTPTKKYGQLLLKQSQSGLQIAQANNFIHSQLKKRILMMTKNKSQRYSLLKYTAILPLVLLLVFSISAKNGLADFTTEQTPITIEKDTVPPQTATGEGAIFQVVEEMPRFKGCEAITGVQERKSCADKKMLEHIYTNIKYPAEARKNNVQGVVVVSFIVEKDGSLTNTKILRKIGGGCDEEVLRIVGIMPDFIPGKQRGKKVRVKYNLPVKFKLEGPAKEKASKSDLSETIQRNFPDGALIILDGKETKTVNNINPADIEDIHVLKGEVAIGKYGERAKNGAVVINTIKAKANIIAIEKSDVPPPPPPPHPTKENGEPIMNVEEMPMFPGTTDRKSSDMALIEFVYKNVKYPKAAKDANIEGTVVAKFTITKEGRVENPKIVRSIGGDTDAEVLRVVELINTLPQKWTPGKREGKAVNVQLNLPVKFKLDPKEKSTKKVEERKHILLEKSTIFEKVDVYPNPSNGTVNIHLYSKQDKPTTISISDSNGKQFYKKVFNDQEIKITDLELRNAANGILFFSFEQDGKVITEEVILQK